jgi:hypothetical protein
MGLASAPSAAPPPLRSKTLKGVKPADFPVQQLIRVTKLVPVGTSRVHAAVRHGTVPRASNTRELTSEARPRLVPGSPTERLLPL